MTKEERELFDKLVQEEAELNGESKRVICKVFNQLFVNLSDCKWFYASNVLSDDKIEENSGILMAER